MLYSDQPTVLLARRDLNTMILTNFENLNSISNIFQETHDFLVLTDPTVLLARRDLSTMILTNFENLNSISNIFQETHDFLVLTDPVIICIYLRTTDRHFRDQGNVRHPTSKLLKCDLVLTLNAFRNPLLPGSHLLFALFFFDQDRIYC